MKRLFLIVFFAINISILFAQREDHTWYFGNTSVGLFFDYNSNAVSQTNVHSTMIEAGSYFVANEHATGQLLFYTDGSKIYDKGHQIMPNGNFLQNAPHAMQTGLACSFPGHSNQFIVFTTTSNISSGSVYFSILDMNLQGNGTSINPKGDVINSSKNIFLTNQACEGMYIIRGTGNCFWLIVPKNSTSNVSVYKIDNTGVNLHNTYNIGLNVGQCVSVRYSYVSHKIGFGNMLGNGASFIMDFNETNGSLSNAFQIPGIISTSTSLCGIVDMEWSPNGQLLYLSKYRECPNNIGKLLQYNTLTPSMPPVLIAQVATSGNNASMGLKLAPNGKIYHRYQSSSNNYLGAINNPDIPGAGCNYNPTDLFLGSSVGIMHKFPEFLAPLNCEQSSTNTMLTENFVCKPNDTTHSNIPITNFVDNPCNDSLNYQIIGVTHGSAHIIGNQIQYVQPNYYIPNDTISILICNNSGLCITSFAYIQLNYVGPVIPISVL